MLILWDENVKIQKENNLNNLVQISDIIFKKTLNSNTKYYL